MYRRTRKFSRRQKKIQVGCALSVCGIWLSLSYVVPWHENVGTLLAMLSAIFAGIFFTRYQQAKKTSE